MAPEESPQPAEPVGPGPQPAAVLRKKLVEEHLPEVRYIARRIHGRLPLHVPLEDLIHDGVLGLIEAVDKFDPHKQVQLKSYAKFRIRGAILDSLRTSDWSPRSLRRRARHLKTIRQEMSAVLSRIPTDAELAAQLGMDLSALQTLQSELRGLDLASLQVFDGHSSLQEDLPFPRQDDAAADPFSLCLRDEMKDHLARAMDGLDERERRVLDLYYRQELTMREAASVLGVTESRVSQIHSAAMLRLRTRLLARLRAHTAA
jgi:RNA polymerase sigma factor for flagellar operon FliA